MRKFIIITVILLNNILYINQTLGQLVNNYEEKLKIPLITIPVVVHVLYYEEIQNIPDEQIYDGIAVLNKDFQLKNEDADKCPERFKSLQANCQIAFCLAQKDPKGNPTTGIIRKKTMKPFFTKPGDIIRGRDADDAKFSSLGGSDIWDRNKYLNIWIVPSIRDGNNTVKGYAQAPYQLFSNSYLTDGVVIEHTWFGVYKNSKNVTALGSGRTATHEVGHWLNLKHIWHFSCLDFDGIGDTPRQRESNNEKCPEGIKISCPLEPDGDMYMNFMDETKDECMNMFTLGQKERIHELFKPGGYRYALQFSDGCSKPQVPGENTNNHSKDPNCNENQNGDFCFQNNTDIELKINFHFNSNIKSKYQISPLISTLQPGQKQCFFGVPEGPSRYEVFTPEKVKGSAIGLGGEKKKPANYSSEGLVYVDRCKENSFIINLDKPSISTSNPISDTSKSKETTCIVTNTGDFCFKNTTNQELKVNFHFNYSSKSRYQTSQLICTLQPGQTQCFFSVPAGPSKYEIKSPAKVQGSGIGSSQPITKGYYAEGYVYVDACKTGFFKIR